MVRTKDGKEEGGALSWWRAGRESGWQGEEKARKKSPEGCKEWTEVSVPGRGSSEKEAVIRTEADLLLMHKD